MTTVAFRARLLVTTCLLGLVWIAPGIAAAQVPTPESHFGFRMGSDGQLASAESIEQYFEVVAARSDRVEIVDIGRTTEGHRTIAAIVSAPENIRKLDQIRAANQRLADPRTIPPDEARILAADHKAVLVIGCSIHASESGATQAANELLHALATSTEPETLHVLQNVVVILIPLLNPDGHRRIVNWHQATRNTQYENAPLPWLYHKYVGHDINRDAFMMNLAESRNLARFFYTVWHPQVFLSMHQMDSDGPRMFVPPVADPIDRNYDPRIWREAALLGSAMAFQLQRDGRAGVVSNALYDYYWPGYEDSAPLGHNTICLLTEVANVSRGTNSRQGEARIQNDLSDNRPRMNYPDPWRGGSWTFRDLIDYDLSAVRGLLTAVAVYREQIVQTFFELGHNAIELGQRGGPFAFIVPSEQHDPHAVTKLEELLMQGGVEIHRALEPFHADGTPYPAGSDIILMAQPFRAYVKTLLERQDYATLGGSRDGAGAPRPYDVAGWTLPAQMGIDVHTIDRTFSPPPMTRLEAASVTPARISGDAKPNYYVIDARGNGGAILVNRLLAAGARLSWTSSELTVNDRTFARGSVVVGHSKTIRPTVERIAADLGMRVEGVPGKPPAGTMSLGRTRVALYRPWLQDADEGWTRWLLERYEFQFVSINDGDIRGGDLRKRYDAIILPSTPSGQLLAGSGPDLVPPQYAGGLGELGVAALKAFVEAGGTLICLNQATAFAIDQFQLPLRDVVREASPSDFFSPGSILRIDLDAVQPISYGMKPRTAGFFSFSSAYDAIQPVGTAGSRSNDTPGAAVRVVARYGAKDILLSGWLDGEQVIAGRSAAVEVGLGTGRIVLLGFATQHRGQSHATFRLLFNSIFTAG